MRLSVDSTGSQRGRHGFAGRVVPESLDQHRQTFFKSVPRSIQLKISLAIKGLSLGENSSKVRHGVSVIGHRTHVTLRKYPLHVLLGGGFYPDSEAGRSQPFKCTRLGDKAASGRHYKTGTSLKCIFQTLALELPETTLPTEIKDQTQTQSALF